MARSSLGWSVALHGGALTLAWFGCGTAVGPTRVAPPLVHVEHATAVVPPAVVVPVAAPAVVVDRDVPVVAEATCDDAVLASEPAFAPLPEHTVRERNVHEPRLARVANARVRRSPPPPPLVPAPAAVAATARVLSPLPGSAPPPEYPVAARRRGWQGTVVIAVDCDEHGFVTHARIVASCGHALLDDAALAAVRAWRFTAGPGSCEQPITFRLAP